MILAAATPAIRFLPQTASTGAGRVDALFFALVAMTVVLSFLIFGSIILFSWRYRRSAKANRVLTGRYNVALEVGWTVIPTIVGIGIFVWASKLYIEQTRIPKNALEIYVVGKQWMWKAQHAEGPREINELHVPVGTPVKLLMTSQDVIHSFFIPAFRAKRDVLPGRFQSEWFEATQLGEYHLFCAEFCGTEHSRMKGRIVVLSTNDYQKWIASFTTNEPAAITGEKLFRQYACESCHRDADSERGPSLVAIFGKTFSTRKGLQQIDENYLVRSIRNPAEYIVEGYSATMPSYKDQVSDEQMIALVAYIKSLNTIAASRQSAASFARSSASFRKPATVTQRR